MTVTRMRECEARGSLVVDEQGVHVCTCYRFKGHAVDLVLPDTRHACICRQRWFHGPFAPTTSRVRDRYIQSAKADGSNDPDPGASFDRWLALYTESAIQANTPDVSVSDDAAPGGAS